MQKGKHIIGKVHLKSDLDISELGKIISEQILGGVVLDGLEKNIYEEVPAIFAQKGLLGLSVVLQGYLGFDNEVGYWFELTPIFSDNKQDVETVNLSVYLTSLFKNKIINSRILIVDESYS
jgi:hypothetical protein